MAVFNEPTKWQTSLVNSGDANTIPQNTPAGTGEASFEDGFPQITQVPIGAGGIAPDRKDFNGLFKVLGDWIFFAQNGGLPTYSSDFDYVVGRYVVYNNTLYKCIQANGASSTVVAPDSVSPLGTDYWKDIENQDSTSLIPNQTIVSELPLTDANLHLKDGALLSGSGAYSAYVDLIADLYNGGTATTSFCTEAEWQTSNTNYGFCNKFVYDSVANTVRLPKINSEHGALIKSYQNGTDWYRIYQDGFCEQGGQSDQGTSYTITFLKPYINTNYSVQAVTVCNNNSRFPMVNVKTTTTLTFAIGRGGDNTINSIHETIWQTSGYVDITDLQTAPIYEYIVVGTVSKTDIQIDIDNVMADLALKADKDFSNVTAPTQAFKDMSIDWGLPDYDRAIDITASLSTTNTQITFTEPSLIRMYCGGSGYFRQLYLNDEIILSAGASGGETHCVTSPFYDSGTYNIRLNVTSYVTKVEIIPCKGAN